MADKKKNEDAATGYEHKPIPEDDAQRVGTAAYQRAQQEKGEGDEPTTEPTE